MYEYPKIETIFNRAIDGSKLLIEGSYRSKFIEMLADYPIWDAYEKLDGTNVQIHWDGHRLNLYGRTKQSDIPKHIQSYYDNKFNNVETEELFEQLFGIKEFVLYFEAIGNKIQAFGKHYGDIRFVLLDVYNVSNDSWWDYNGITQIAKSIDVECKTVIKSNTTLKEIISLIKEKPRSQFSNDDLPIEGAVCVLHNELKDANNNRIIVKIKGTDFISDWKQFMKPYR